MLQSSALHALYRRISRTGTPHAAYASSLTNPSAVTTFPNGVCGVHSLYPTPQCQLLYYGWSSLSITSTSWVIAARPVASTSTATSTSPPSSVSRSTPGSPLHLPQQPQQGPTLIQPHLDSRFCIISLEHADHHELSIVVPSGNGDGTSIVYRIAENKKRYYLSKKVLNLRDEILRRQPSPIDGNRRPMWVGDIIDDDPVLLRSISEKIEGALRAIELPDAACSRD
ncbi:hypothetical protein H4Q26_005294 [Puccinia striiformis f. sp. tritici PST-130]|nr:hypothetical protein H4Q26_005294 [Puccinia striiformis f. sp. tritici PST-130]